MPAPTMTPAELEAAERDERYQSLIEDAIVEFEAGHFLEARALFRSAHATSPSARTLRGIGVSSFELHDYAAAYAALGEALSSTARPLTESQRIEATGLRERAASFLARYRLDHLPEGVSVVVDGVPTVPLADGSLVLALGSHAVVVRIGDEVFEATVRVAGGEVGPLPVAVTERRPTEAPAPTVIYVETEDEAPPRRRRIGLAVAASSGAVGATGAMMGLFARGRRREIEEARVDTSWSSVARSYELGPRLGRAGAVLGPAGLGGLAAGMAIALRDGPVAASVEPSAHGVRVVVAGRLR